MILAQNLIKALVKILARVFLGLEDPFPKLLASMAGKESWLMVRGLSGSQSGPSHRLLVCPQDTAAGVLWSERGESGKVERQCLL